jgi:peptidyl-prolyl cis-trans isomerase C
MFCIPALAQTPAPAPAAPAPAATGSATAPAADPVVAKVGSDEIHASELAEAAQGMPEELRGMPPQMLYPMLLDQLIDRKAIVIEGRKQGLQNDPAVKRQVERATDTAIQNLLLTRAISPTLTDDAIKAAYEKQYAGKPGEEEVHAEHILVADEAKAKEIIAQLKAGKDFTQLAKDNSTDPSAKTNSGDLGWFKKTDMLPEFSDAAFALKPGEFTQTPVKTRFGYHIIKLLETRTAPPPTLDAVRDEIRQQLIQEGVAKVLAQAKQGLAIEKFNQDGTPMKDAPTPPAAPVK